MGGFLSGVVFRKSSSTNRRLGLGVGRFSPLSGTSRLGQLMQVQNQPTCLGGMCPLNPPNEVCWESEAIGSEHGHVLGLVTSTRI